MRRSTVSVWATHDTAYVRPSKMASVPSTLYVAKSMSFVPPIRIFTCPEYTTYRLVAAPPFWMMVSVGCDTATRASVSELKHVWRE
jgi:hypothetical protein